MSFVKPCRVAAFFAVCLLSVFAPTAQAVPVTFQSIMSGDWNNGLTWDQLGAVPDADDIVIISDNTIVTVTQTSDVAGSVSFSPISFGASLQIANGAKLTVSGDVSISDGGFANATLNAGDGNLVVTGKIHIYEGINGGVGKLAIGSGNVSCANLLVTTTNAADTQIAFSGPGVLTLRGSMDSSAQLSNFTGGGGSTVKFAGTAAQVIGNYVYQNLTIANTAASVVANGTFTVNGKLDVQSASTFIVRNGFNAGTAAALQMSGTSLLRLGDEVVSFNVVMPDFASYTLAAASTISYSANVAQTVNPDVPYQHLEVSFLGSAGTPIKIMGGDTTVLGDLKIEQTGTGTVTLDVGTSVVTVAGNLTGDGGLAFLSGGELRLAGDFSNIGAFSGGNGTFVYNGGQFQNVRPLPYNNLYITGTNTNATLSSNGGAAATLKVDADSYFDLNTTFTVTDTLRVNGVVNGTGDTLTVSSSASPIEGSGAIYAHVNVGSRSIASTAALLFGGNVTIGTSQTVTNNGAVTILNSVNGSLATWINAANSSLTVAGNVMPNGTLTANANPNTVSYNGLGQTVAAGTYHHLIFTTTPIATPGVKTMPVSALTINGDFTIAGASNVTATNAINVAGGFTLDDTATFSAGSFTHSVMGDWSISGGTFTPANSTLLFNGGGAQSIGASDFHHVHFDGTGAKTLAGALNLTGDFAIFSGVSVSAGIHTIYIGGNWSDPSDTFIPGGGTVFVNGSSASTVDGTFTDLTVGMAIGGSLAPSGSVTVGGNFEVSSGSFALGSNSLAITGDLIVQGGASFALDSGSVSVGGDVATDGTVTGATGTLTLDGAAIQTWTGTSPTIHNLTLNKSASLNLGTDINVNGFLTLTNGVIVTGIKKVSVTDGQNISRTNGYIHGILHAAHSGAGAKLYPMGSALGYSPVIVTIAAAGQLTISIEDSAHPNNTGGNAEILQSYWTFANNTIPGAVDLQFNWPAGAVNGTEANYVLANYNGAWSRPASSVNAATHTASAIGITSLPGDWTVGAPASVTTSYDLEITTDGSADAGAPESITITAVDGLGNTVTSYSGDHTLVFAGASSSPAGNDPVVYDKSGAQVLFGANTVLSFTNGVATTNAVFYTNETVSLNATEPSASVIGTQTSITVAAAVPSKLTVSDVNAGQPLYANGAFTLGITAADAYGNTSAVYEDTDVTVSTSSCGTCTGSLSGTLTLQIPTGSTSANFSDLRYSVAEANVVISASTPTTLTGVSTAALTFSAQSAGYTVTTNANSGAGSLREAILQANSGACGTPCNITFDILPAGAYTFQLTSRLPSINAPVVIDGNTQDGFTGTPILAIDGALFTGSTGFELNGGNSTIRGFILQNLGASALKIASDFNVVQNCWIGTSLTGTTGAGNGTGIGISGNNNTIGGNVAASRNVISGNTTGVFLFGTANNNAVRGNYIGTNVAGTGAIANGNGVTIYDNASLNVIGGSTAAERNVIAGNTAAGISLEGTGVASVTGGGIATNSLSGRVLNNQITGNYIGVAPDGVTAIANGAGIDLAAEADSNSIGVPGAGNVISGNGMAILLSTGTVTSNTIRANLIGVGADGTTAVPNVNGAISLIAAYGNSIGGLTAADGNTIANNGGAGVVITGSGGANTILANSIPSFATQPIDLDGDGADFQDPGDGDNGANGKQNYPVIDSANVNGGNLQVALSLDASGAAVGSLRVELFEANASSGPVNSLGSVCIALDTLASTPVSVPVGTVVVGDKIVGTATSYTDATCTSPLYGTSEISGAATVSCVPPSVTITGPTSTCPSSPITLDAGAGFSSYLWSNGATTQTITVTPSGTQSYSVTVTNANGCPASDSHTVTVNPAPTVSISGPTNACDSATLDAGAGFASYAWSNGATTQTITVTTGGSYNVTVTDANGCTATASHSLTITATPAATITASGPTTFCAGGSVTLTANNAASYGWSTGATTQSIVVTAGGTYTVQTSNGGCNATSAATVVTVHATPTVNITGPSSACDSATLDAGAGFASYLWSNGATTQTINVTSGGTYNVTVTDANGCTATASHVIAITATPAATITPSGPTTFCAGGSVTLTASNAASYLWSTGDTTQSIVVSAGGSYSVQTSNGSCTVTSAPTNVTVHSAPIVNATGPANACDSATLDAGPGFASYLWSTGATTQTITVTSSGTYTVTVTDANGCTASDTDNVTITTSPVVNITGPASSCDNATLDAGPGFSSYLWSTGETTQTIVVNTSGAYSVTVTNGACSATDSHNVTISNSLTPVISGPASACASQSVTLDAGTGFASYLWSTGATTQTISVNATGTYNVTVTTAGGCSGSDSHNVTIHPAATATISADGPTTFCSGEDVVLTASAGSSWLWSNGATTQSITVTTNGSYSVTVTDGNACSATSAPTTVTVHTPPAVTIGGPTATCEGSQVVLDAGPGFSSYLWSTGETTQTITLTPAGTASYTVTVTNAAGCSATDSHTVTVSATPIATIAAPQTVCSATGGHTASVGVQPGASYSWTISNGTIDSGASSDTINFTAGSQGTVTLSVIVNDGSCTSSGSVQIPIVAPPTATISAPSSANANATGLSASVPAQPGATYQWTVLNGTLVSGAATNAITFNAGASGTTKVMVTVTLNGCSTSSFQNVTINGTQQPTTADVSVAKSAPSTVQAGALLSYSIDVANHGPADASDVKMIDTLPAGVTVTSINDGPWNCSTSNGRVTCSGALLAGANRLITITVSAPQQTGAITNTARIESNISDPVSNNNVSSVTTNVTAAPVNCSTVPPSLIAPAENASVSSPVAFSWSTVAGATEYELWFVTADGTLLAGTTASTSFSKAVPSGSSNWYVVARFAGDCTPLVSAQRAFTVAQSDNCATHALPQLTSPIAGSTTGANVTFSWLPVPQAIGYRVWIEANGTGAQDLGTTNGAITLTADVPPGALVAYLDALFSGCPATRSAAVAFNVPRPDACGARTSPVALAPVSNATVNSSNVHFAWSAAANAVGYRVWYAIDNATAHVLAETPDTSTDATIGSGAVTWWIEALFDGCSSLESQHLQFTIPRRNDCATAAASLVSPANDTTVTNAEVTFHWTSVPNAVGYELWLAVANGEPTLVGTTTSTSLTRVAPAGKLQWFVRALLDRCPSRDSQPSRFTLTPPAACADNQRPTAIAPLSNARVTSAVTFSWSASAGATSYEVFSVRGKQAPQRLATVTTNTATINVPNGHLRWFVRANFNGCAPLDSTEEKLEVVAPPAACTKLEAPEVAAAGQISSGVPFLLQWTPIAGATSYQLQLASNSKFTDAQLVSTTETKHELVRTNSGNAPVGLYARVRAIDNRCRPEPTVTPYGPSSAIFILPLQGRDAAAPVNGGPVNYELPLGPELAGQSFSVSVKDPWLTVTPMSGVVPAGGMTLIATANTSALPLGTSLAAIRITLSAPSSGNVKTNATTVLIPTLGVSKSTPVVPSPKTAPPPDALIIPAVAHANGMNARFESDVRVTNSSAKLMQYEVTFTPSGDQGLASGRQTTFGIEPGQTIALDDVLSTWFSTGGESAVGTLEIRPVTEALPATPAFTFNGLTDLVTFASSRTFSVTPNGTFGQYIPAVPYANFIGRVSPAGLPTALSLQQIAHSERYRTNLGIVEASGEPASLVVSVFGDGGQKLTEFPVQLAGGQHAQLNGFLAANGISSLNDGRVEIAVTSPGGKITAYASVLDNATNDPLLVTPVTLTETGASKWVLPGVADVAGVGQWQTDMRVFNHGTEAVDATVSFYSQNGGEPRVANVTIPAGQVRQFDRTLNSLFGITGDAGAVHISTPGAARLVATGRTYNQTSNGTYGQFISAVTPGESAGIESRPLQLLQVEESSRFRSNIGFAEVTGNPVTLELSFIPPDTKFTSVTELRLGANEFRQLGSVLRSVGLADTFNTRVTVRVIEGNGRVTAYASVIDQLTNDPTYVPAQ